MNQWMNSSYSVSTISTTISITIYHSTRRVRCACTRSRRVSAVVLIRFSFAFQRAAPLADLELLFQAKEQPLAFGDGPR